MRLSLFLAAKFESKRKWPEILSELFFTELEKMSKVKAKTKERHQVRVPFHFRN